MGGTEPNCPVTIFYTHMRQQVSRKRSSSPQAEQHRASQNEARGFRRRCGSPSQAAPSIFAVHGTTEGISVTCRYLVCVEASEYNAFGSQDLRSRLAANRSSGISLNSAISMLTTTCKVFSQSPRCVRSPAASLRLGNVLNLLLLRLLGLARDLFHDAGRLPLA